MSYFWLPLSTPIQVLVFVCSGLFTRLSDGIRKFLADVSIAYLRKSVSPFFVTLID